MTLDELLRETLTDERRALPGWPDATDRVHAGVTRRRRRRVRLAGAGAAAVVALLVGVPALLVHAPATALPPTRPAHPSPSGTVVPFVHQPGVVPDPADPLPRPIGAPCTAADLPPTATVVNTDPRHWVIALHIVGDRTCTLSGYPWLSVQDTTGRPVTMRFPNSLPAPPPGYSPATADPGQVIEARMDNLGSCDTGFSPQTPPLGLTFTLLTEDVRIAVTGPFWPAACTTVVMSPWYRPWPGKGSETILADAGLTTTIAAPDSVRAGEQLDYVVTLHNPGDHPVALQPCPVFRQDFDEVAELLALNCGQAPAAIPAHGSVSFAMVLPAQTFLGKTGPFDLHWQIEEAGGPSAGATATVKVTQ